MTASPSAFARLVELVLEREELDPLSVRHVYISGRIDECCEQHGIAEVDRDAAVAAVSLAIRDRRRQHAETLA